VSEFLRHGAAHGASGHRKNLRSIVTDIGVKLYFSSKILVCVHRSQYLLQARSDLLKVTGTRFARIILIWRM